MNDIFFLLLTAPLHTALPGAMDPIEHGGVVSFSAGAAARDLATDYTPDIDGAFRLGLLTVPMDKLALNTSIDGHTRRWSVGARYRLIERTSFELAPTVGALGYGTLARPDVFIGVALGGRITEALSVDVHWPLMLPLGLLASEEAVTRAFVPYGVSWIPLLRMGMRYQRPRMSLDLALDGSAPLGAGAELGAGVPISERILLRGALWWGVMPLSGFDQGGFIVEATCHVW